MLSIQWQPPRDNGGAPLQMYIIEKREANRNYWVQAGTCTPDVTAHVVTNLAENQAYYLRVLAENAYGFSEPLELEQPIIPKRIFGECVLRVKCTYMHMHARTHIVNSRCAIAA